MMLERKDVFQYRIINEDFYVSQQTLMRLVETLYSEELIGVPLDIGWVKQTIEDKADSFGRDRISEMTKKLERTIQ